MDIFKRYLVPLVICCIGVACIVYGLFDGEVGYVLTKAINVCKECIGIG